MQRILVCLRYGIGDLVMEMPVLRQLRRERPHAHLTALGARPAVQLLDEDPVVDEVVTVQDLGFEHWGDEGSESARQGIMRWLGDKSFDCILDGCHAVAGIREVLEETDIPQRDSGSRVDAPDAMVDGRGVFAIWNAAIHAWGLAARGPCPPVVLHIPPQARARARRFFLQRWDRDEEVIAIAPVASSRLKRWPLARVVELIHRLNTHRGSRILVFGVPEDDDATAAQLRAACAPEDMHILPLLHLQHTAALLERCRALVSNDTGLMHIAAAVGIGTVAVFGPSSPRVALPPGSTAVDSAVPCAHRPANHFGPGSCVIEDRCLIAEDSCIAVVPVDTVAESLYRVLSQALLTRIEEE